MRYPFDATGTIGSRPCEVRLNQILAEKNDPKITKAILRLLQKTRVHLQAIKNIAQPSQRYLKKLMRIEAESRLSQIVGGPVRGMPIFDPLTTHAMCCLNAYFGEKHERNDSPKDD